MSMEGFEYSKVVSIGGLNSNINHIYLSDNEPGSAVELLNFETSLYGGYRRLSGFLPLVAEEPVVDPAGAEGRILTVAFLGSSMIVARKQIAGNTYDFYQNSGTSWVKLPTAFSKSSLQVSKIRWATYNFKGQDRIVFVDGVNFGMIYDGTTFYQIKSTNTGADDSNAGGDQAIDRPRYVEVFKNTVFLAQDNLVVNSAPLADFDFTVANGAGQIPAGFTVNQIKLFRDAMYVFGVNNIKNITVTTGDDPIFVLNETTANIGLLASDSVVEINGSLVFLSQDGFRPISGTDKIGDIELESISRKVQQTVLDLIRGSDLDEVSCVLVRGKTQVRFFFSASNIAADATLGIIGCIRGDLGQTTWEWGRLQGIRASCASSRYIGATEFVVHGDYDGTVYRQEVGNTFNGSAVTAVYTTPYLDFGDAGARKTMHSIKLFVRPEGDMVINANLTYDWKAPEKLNPSTYGIGSSLGSVATYDFALYDFSVYSSVSIPVLLTNVEGSGFSVQVSYSTSDTNPPYTIQGALYKFNVEGKK